MSQKAKDRRSTKPKAPKKLNLSELAILSERSKKFDPNATEETCVLDLRALQERNPTKHITRNFYRVHGKFSDATWSQFFGTFLEFRRQAGLELSRNQHCFERKIAKQASLDVYRKFYDEEILPYHNKFEKPQSTARYKTIAICSDLHDIDIDPFLWAVFLDTCKRIQPDIIVLNGDVFDLYEMSRFDKDYRRVQIAERASFVKTHFFGGLRRACPSAQIDLIAGNHEWRMMKMFADKTPALRVWLSEVMGLTLSDMFGLDEFEINLVCKVDLAAFSNVDVNEELKENYKIYYNSFVVSHFKDLSFGISGTSGHTHKPDQNVFSNIPMGKLTWTNTGCMCRTRVDYTEARDREVNSFMLAHVDTEKKSVSPEHFIATGDHLVVQGKRYVRAKGK